MFNSDDIHPLTGKYKHIIIPPGVKKLKVTMKDGKTKTEHDGEPAPRRSPVIGPRYRDAGSI